MAVVARQDLMDLGRGSGDIRDGGIMIEEIDDRRHIFAHIRHGEPGTVLQLLRLIGQVRRDDHIKIAPLISLIKNIQSVCKESERRAQEYVVRVHGFELFCGIQDRTARRDHVIHDDDVFAREVGAQEFMGDDRILAAYDA